MKKSFSFIVCMVFVLAGLGMPVPKVHAQAHPYSVSDVHVDVQAESAYKAREEAIVEAQVKAFDRMAKKLLPENEYQYLPNFDNGVILALVRDFAVSKEQTSSTRYRATFSVRFHEDKVEDLFEKTGISYSNVTRKPILIVPVLQIGKRYVMWEEPNPWREAWRMADIPSGLVPVQVPVGDIADIQDVPGIEVFSSDAKGLTNMAYRYDADKVFFAVAKSNGAALNPSDGLQVSIYYYDEQTSGMRRAGALATATGKSGDDAWDESVVQVVQEIRKQWKQQTLGVAGQESQIAVRIPINDLRDWVRIQQRLDETEPLSAYHVEALTKAYVDAMLEYAGSLSRLELALEQRDLGFVENAGQDILTPRRILTLKQRRF